MQLTAFFDVHDFLESHVIGIRKIGLQLTRTLIMTSCHLIILMDRIVSTQLIISSNFQNAIAFFFLPI